MEKDIFDRGIVLQMAQMQEEALKILRTDPILTEEEAQEMSKSWAETGSEKDVLVQGEPKKAEKTMLPEQLKELLTAENVDKMLLKSILGEDKA